MRLGRYIAIAFAALYFIAATDAHGQGDSGTSGIPDFLLKPSSDPDSSSGLINGLQMNSTKRPSYKDNPKWTAYQKRRDARKKYALQQRAAYNNSKDWSRTPLNYRLNIDITNPLNINPWSNYRGNARFHRRPLYRLPLIPWMPDLEILSPGDSLR